MSKLLLNFLPILQLFSIIPSPSLGFSIISPLPSSSSLLSTFSSFNPNSIFDSSSLSTTKCYTRNFHLLSSFYSDFEEFENEQDDEEEEDDEEDDEDDEFIDLDEKAFANFKAKMGGGSSVAESNFNIDDDGDEEEDDDDDEYENDIMDTNIGSKSFSTVDDLINFATSSSSETGSSSTSSTQPTEWATPIETSTESSIDFAQILKGGTILLANPAKFTNDIYDIDDKTKSTKLPSSALLAKFGLTIPPPAEIGPDRRADLLPVLIILERHPLRGSQALLLNRRTGYLIGDLEQNQLDSDDDDIGGGGGSSFVPPPQLGAFMIQPLWFGGTSSGPEQNSSSKGLEMLHLCSIVDDAVQLTDDGLYWGGDPIQAQELMNDSRLDRVLTGFDFKFFVQTTRWLPLQLEKEIRDGTWIMANVSKEVLFKSRDRLGVKRAKPLWTEVMELMGGKYKDIRDQLYGDES